MCTKKTERGFSDLADCVKPNEQDKNGDDLSFSMNRGFGSDNIGAKSISCCVGKRVFKGKVLFPLFFSRKTGSFKQH